MKRLMVVFSLRDKTFVNVPDTFKDEDVKESLPAIEREITKLYPLFTEIRTIYNEETKEIIYED